MELSLETITKGIGAITASLALAGGSYSLWDKMKAPEPILTWHGEYFKIQSGPANGEFAVVVAREKHRDDCEVKEFKLEVKDSEFQLVDYETAKYYGQLNQIGFSISKIILASMNKDIPNFVLLSPLANKNQLDFIKVR